MKGPMPRAKLSYVRRREGKDRIDFIGAVSTMCSPTFTHMCTDQARLGLGWEKRKPLQDDDAPVQTVK